MGNDALNKSQSEKFKEAARELGTDEDEKAWDKRLRKVAKPRRSETPRREPNSRD